MENLPILIPIINFEIDASSTEMLFKSILTTNHIEWNTSWHSTDNFNQTRNSTGKYGQGKRKPWVDPTRKSFKYIIMKHPGMKHDFEWSHPHLKVQLGNISVEFSNILHYNYNISTSTITYHNYNRIHSAEPVVHVRIK